MYEPMVALESTAMMTPPWKMKPRVVVPWQGFTISTTCRSKESSCRSQHTSSVSGCALLGSDQLASREAGGVVLQIAPPSRLA